MASPIFLSDGSTPRRTDAIWAIEQKILGAVIDGGGGGGGGTGTGQAGMTGIGSPEGVKTATPGTIYLDTATNSFYVKGSGAGNTGWVPIVT